MLNKFIHRFRTKFGAIFSATSPHVYYESAQTHGIYPSGLQCNAIRR